MLGTDFAPPLLGALPSPPAGHLAFAEDLMQAGGIVGAISSVSLRLATVHARPRLRATIARRIAESTRRPFGIRRGPDAGWRHRRSDLIGLTQASDGACSAPTSRHHCSAHCRVHPPAIWHSPRA